MVSISVDGMPKIGMEVTLNCIAMDGNPNTFTYSWCREEEELDGETTSSLTFSPEIDDDGKDYICKVNNGVFETSASTTLDLNSEFRLAKRWV